MSLKDRRIICVGNRFLESDDIGPRVYDYLARQNMPEDISLVDGGLMGLDLIRFIDGARRVVFVDTLRGFSQNNEPLLPDDFEVPARYGHEGGLAYLLRMLPALCEQGLPDIALVGAEPSVGPRRIAEVAKMALSAAAGEKYEREHDRRVDAQQRGAP